MIKKIAHFADIHIKDYKTELEYRQVFEEVYKSLSEQKVDRIVVAGDLFHTKNNVKNEAKILARDFLCRLSELTEKVIIINGNHDGNPNNKEQINSLKTLVDLIANPKIYYLDRSYGYIDDNVQWMVWDYFDGKNPYEVTDIENNKTVIDLYHNPVQDCVFFNGMITKSGFSIENFKGSYFLLGDIHKRQFFNTLKGIGAYPGSLIQNDFGEDLNQHGYIVWDIENKSYQEIDIKNKHSFQTLRINSNELIDLLNVNSINSDYDYINLRVIWEEKESNINIEEERRIKRKIQMLWGDKIVKLRFYKYPQRESYSSVIENGENNLDSDVIDVSNTQVLEQIMSLYLKENGWNEEKISKILDLDKKVLEIVTYEHSFIQWNLKEIELENYRSHGDKFKLSLENKDGIYQIKGLNEQGKTNLLSSIMYLLYGKTLETYKKEKNGDLRFINNKSDKNFCKVSAIISINNEDYYLERITERKWNKDKSEASASTKFNWNIVNATNENAENRIKSQKILDSAIGTYEDFLRASYITADSLNNLLSQNESEFLDALLRDSGMEIFEKKNEAWKAYEKKNPIIDYKVDINSYETNIQLKHQQIKDNEFNIKTNLDLIKTNSTDLKKLQTEKEKLLLSLQEIPNLRSDYLIDSEIDVKQHEVSNYNLLIEENNKAINKIKDWTPDDDTDYEKYIGILTEFENEKIQIQSNIQSKKTEINNLELSKGKFNSQILVDQNKISNLEKDILNVDNTINNEVARIEATNKNLQESTVCITCNREKDANSIIEINNNIQLNKDRIKFLLESESITLKSNLELQIKDLNVKINEDKTELISIDNKINLIQLEIKNCENEFISKFTANNQTLSKKQDLDAKKQLFKEKQNYFQKIENIKLKIDIVNKDIELLNNEKKEAKKWIKLAEAQNIINDNIINISTQIACIDKNISIYTESNNSYLMYNSQLNLEINNLLDMIEKQKEYESELIIRNGYEKLIHRNGLPKYLLSKLKNKINIALSNMLSPLSFNAGFDENMNLKMWDNINEDFQMNVLNGSGKQRTFISLALRLALRSINLNCVNNVLFMDELMGKLVENSVDEFVELLAEIKEKIQLIFIVEHAYSEYINPDYILEVKKDEKGISSINYKNN